MSLQSGSYDTQWTCSCGVDMVTELAEGHQLAHARKHGMKKNFQSFPFRWHKPDTCVRISFIDTIFLFWIPYIIDETSRRVMRQCNRMQKYNMYYVMYNLRNKYISYLELQRKYFEGDIE
jgi:hypothetical protein